MADYSVFWKLQWRVWWYKKKEYKCPDIGTQQYWAKKWSMKDVRILEVSHYEHQPKEVNARMDHLEERRDDVKII